MSDGISFGGGGGGGFQFGASNPAPTQVSSVFGANPASAQVASAFGSNPASAQVGSAFGSNPASAQVASAFGSNPATAQVGSAFGSNPATAQVGSAFGSNPASAQVGSAFGSNPGTTSTQPAASAGFSFGSSGFGGAAAPLNFGSTGFSFPSGNISSSAAVAAAAAGTTAAGSSLSLGLPSAATTKSSGLNFGVGSLGGSAAGTTLLSQSGTNNQTVPTTTASTAAAGSMLGFGGGLATGLSGGLFASAPSTTTSQPFSFGGLGGTPASTNASGGLKLGGFGVSLTTASTTQVPASGDALKLGGSLSTAATTSSVLGGLLTGAKPVTASSGGLGGFSFATTSATTTTASTGLSLGGQSSLPASSAGFGISSNALSSAATTPGFSLTFAGGSSSVPATTSAAPSITATASSAGSTAAAPAMNYRQLEDAINKWTQELEEQEAIFLEQATQVNAWDRLLIDNGDLINQLNQDVEKVKADQQRLDQELDFILGQQSELEDMLKPLEQALEQLPPIIYQQHADLEREHTYKLAENVDSQLKRMAYDLKEIVEHLNSGTNAQDSNDPLIQIAKILNAHVDSLHWIDQKTGALQRRVEDVARQSNTHHRQQTYQ